MAEKRQIILDITARTGDLAKRIDEINLALFKNGEQLAKLNKDYKQGIIPTQEEYAKQSAILKNDTKGLRNELRDITKQQELNTKATNSAKGSNEQLKAELALLTRSYNKLSKEERENTDAGEKLQKTIKGISDELKDNEKAVGNTTRNVGNYQEAIESAIGSVGGFGGQLGSVATGMLAGGGIVAAVGLLKDGVIAAGQAIIETTKEFTNYLRVVEQITGATGEAATEIVASVQGISQTFETDFNETLFSANALAKQFGITVPESLGLIEESLLKGGNASGELLDIISEYSTQFQAAGLDAEAFISIATQQVSSGIFSDKGVDAIKEALLRIRELPQPTRDALDAIGLTSDEIAASLADGSTTVFEVIQQVSGKLNELPPQSAEVGQAIADIFGGPGEDAGLAYLQSLRDIDLELSNVGGSSNELVQQQKAQLEAEKDLARQQSILADNFKGLVSGSGTLLTVIQSELLEAFNSLSEVFKPIIQVFRELIGQFSAIAEEAGFAGGETNIFQGIIRGLGKAIEFILTPTRLIISAISSLVGFVRKAYQESDIFRNTINNLIAPFKLLYTVITNFNAVIAGFKASFKAGTDFILSQAELLAINLEILARKVEDFFSTGDEVEKKIQALEAKKAALQNVGADLGDAFSQAYNEAIAASVKPPVDETTTERSKPVVRQSGNELGQEFAQGFNEGVAERILPPAPPETSSISFDVELPDPENDPLIQAEQARLAKEQELRDQARIAEFQREADWRERLAAFTAKKDAEQLSEQRRIAAEEAQIEELRRQEKLDTAEAIAAAAQLGVQILGETTEAGKALGIIQATVSTYVAANKALAEGGAAGPILAAVVIATGLANVLKIVKAKDGGLITGPGTETSDSIPALLSNGEAVINARATKRFAPVLSYINESTGGNPIRLAKGGIAKFADGGLASALSASIDNGAFAQQKSATQEASAQATLLNDNIRNMPAPVVTVKDINSVTNRVRVKDNTRRL